jgi:hypothetical protein
VPPPATLDDALDARVLVSGPQEESCRMAADVLVLAVRKRLTRE